MIRAFDKTGMHADFYAMINGMLFSRAKGGTNTEKRVIPDAHLSGARIYLRPPQERDWQQWARVRAANRDALQPFEPTWPDNCLTRDFFRRRIQRQHRDWHNDRAYAFLIFDKIGDELIGGININNVARGAAQYASLGYWLAEDRRGRGYMKEAGHLICEYAFDTLNLHRLNAACVPENTPSQHMLLKLGFTREGYAPKFLQINGWWRDHILYGLPVEDYVND